MIAETYRFVLVLCLALPGLLMAVVPWITPAGEVFAVTVPSSARHDPRIKRLRVGYAAAVIALTVVVVAVGAATSDNLVLYCVLVTLLPVLGFAAMLVCRSRVQAIKAAEGWSAAGEKTVAAVLPEAAPKPIPLAWNLLYVPIILVTIAIMVMLYPSMPDQIPVHAGLDGTINRWASKTNLLEIGFPVLMQVFMAAVMAGCHWGVLKSKSGRPSSRPVAGALAYGKFAQLETTVVLGMGLALTASMGLIVLTYAEILSLNDAAILIMVVTLVSAGIAVGVSLWCGQSGARLLSRADESDHIDVDNDEWWKAGVFYWAPDDPSIFVPKRFGMGWTLNFGNWRSWAIMVAFVAVTVGIVVLSIVMTSQG